LQEAHADAAQLRVQLREGQQQHRILEEQRDVAAASAAQFACEVELLSARERKHARPARTAAAAAAAAAADPPRPTLTFAGAPASQAGVPALVPGSTACASVSTGPMSTSVSTGTMSTSVPTGTMSTSVSTGTAAGPRVAGAAATQAELAAAAAVAAVVALEGELGTAAQEAFSERGASDERHASTSTWTFTTPPRAQEVCLQEPGGACAGLDRVRGSPCASSSGSGSVCSVEAARTVAAAAALELELEELEEVHAAAAALGVGEILPRPVSPYRRVRIQRDQRRGRVRIQVHYSLIVKL
jgi:hypothetical protein